MWNNQNCNDCQCSSLSCSNSDKLALLKEREQILEAKLSTVKQLIKTAEAEKVEQK